MRLKQQEIIRGLGVRPIIDPIEEIERRTKFLADYLAAAALDGLVLGISGGQDSLLAGMLAQHAVERSRKAGHEAYFHAMLLPYGEQIDRADALLAIETIRPDHVEDINIKDAVDASVASYIRDTGQPVSDFAKGNMKARERMETQYLHANLNNLGVVGTGHAAEAVMGFCTKYGDGAADIAPLWGLTKRQGRAMLQALGAPAVFMTKAPTADLLDGTPGQPDENELGLAYDSIDDYLEAKDIPDEPAIIIENQSDKTAHKRTTPVTPEFRAGEPEDLPWNYGRGV